MTYAGDYFNHSCDSCSLQIHKVMRFFSNIGKRPICNGHPERAPHIGTFCFPLCWRCSSFSLSCLIITPFLNYIACSLPVFFLSTLLCIPCLIDGVLQKCTDYQSSNKKRIITGGLAGIGLRLLLHIWLKEFRLF